ncbi:MAG TPA: hypothetical protein PKH07_19800, partial [bacterium]|nr:hypothetical protein [bacterium]
MKRYAFLTGLIASVVACCSLAGESFGQAEGVSEPLAGMCSLSGIVRDASDTAIADAKLSLFIFEAPEHEWKAQTPAD